MDVFRLPSIVTLARILPFQAEARWEARMLESCFQAKLVHFIYFSFFLKIRNVVDYLLHGCFYKKAVCVNSSLLLLR